MLGTFLVRSGVLTSVHAFAVDPKRGLFILIILAVFVGGSLALFALRARDLKQGGLFAPVSREGALVLNNLLLTAATATVLVGTLYPLALEALNGNKISVGPPYFNATFGPLAAALLCAVPFGPLLAWKRGDLGWAVQRLWLAAGFAAVAAAVAAFMAGQGAVLAAPVAGLAIFVICRCRSRNWSNARHCSAYRSEIRFAAPPACRARPGAGRWRMRGWAWRCSVSSRRRPGARSTSTWSARTSRSKSPDVRSCSSDMFLRDAPNHRTWSHASRCVRMGWSQTMMEPAKRTFRTRQMTTTEAALATFGFSQLYVSLGEVAPDGSAVAVRAQWKPLVLLIWLGPVLMAFGGMLSLTDRRYRVGAPRPARRRGCGRSGGMTMRAALLAFLMTFAAPALAIDPGEQLARCRRRRRGGGAFQRTSLHGLPEPVDPRFRRAAGEGSCGCWSASEWSLVTDPDAIKDFLVARYGDFVLLKPRLNEQTALLWAVPVLVLVIGGVAVVLNFRRRTAIVDQTLSEDEKRRLEALKAEDAA